MNARRYFPLCFPPTVSAIGLDVWRSSEPLVSHRGRLERFSAIRSARLSEWATFARYPRGIFVAAAIYSFVAGAFGRVGCQGGKPTRRGDPRLLKLSSIFQQFVAELTCHMWKEETVLFPLCRQMEQGTFNPAESHCGSVQNPIRVMMSDHDDAGEALEQMA